MNKLNEKLAKLDEAQARALALGKQIGEMSLVSADDSVIRFRVLAGFHRALWDQCSLFLRDACGQ